jgi:8-oxo-dGTP diphosphatase
MLLRQIERKPSRTIVTLSLRDLAFRLAFRLGYPIARVWWRLSRPKTESAVVAIYVGTELLLVRQSYRRGWHLPGGGVKRGETAEAAAKRELQEELGIVVTRLRPAGVACEAWCGRRDRTHLFEARLVALPSLGLDNREIVAAKLFSQSELERLALVGPVAAYLGRRCNAHWC